MAQNFHSKHRAAQRPQVPFAACQSVGYARRVVRSENAHGFFENWECYTDSSVRFEVALRLEAGHTAIEVRG